MARSLSNAKLLSFLIDCFSVSINRRGYAAPSEGVAVAFKMAKGSGSRSNVVKAVQDTVKATKNEASEKKFWAPDPVTGYYRPENITGEIDAAALREKVCNKAVRR